MEDEPETERSKRNGVLNLYYYISLVALGIAVVWHWIFGGHWGYFGQLALWGMCAFIVLGFLNAIGLFGHR